MKKVIAVLPDNRYMVTTAATAEKNNWYVAYNAEVIKEEKEKPDPRLADNLPASGTLMAGVGGYVYRISKIDPEHVCAVCRKPNSKNRIGKRFYCTNDYKQLVVTKPIVSNGTIPGRNEPCRCGSGKKYKHCCMASDQHEPRHYFNSEYKRREEQNKKSA